LQAMDADLTRPVLVGDRVHDVDELRTLLGL